MDFYIFVIGGILLLIVSYVHHFRERRASLLTFFVGVVWGVNSIITGVYPNGFTLSLMPLLAVAYLVTALNGPRKAKEHDK